jgi:hypothetical protein
MTPQEHAARAMQEAVGGLNRTQGVSSPFDAAILPCDHGGWVRCETAYTIDRVLTMPLGFVYRGRFVFRAIKEAIRP